MTRMLISFMILTLGISANAQENPEGFAIVGGMLIDGYEAPPVHNAVVLVRGNRIVASGPAHEVQVPDRKSVV